jgi:hypothetical protein
MRKLHPRKRGEGRDRLKQEGVTNPKYDLVELEEVSSTGDPLYQIVANNGFYAQGNSRVDKGDLGGIVSGWNNLSQLGKCWIQEGARCLESFIVMDDAFIESTAQCGTLGRMAGKTIISGKVQGGYSTLIGVHVGKNSEVFADPESSFGIFLSGDIRLWGQTKITDSVSMSVTSSGSLSDVVIGGRSRINVGQFVAHGDIRILDCDIDGENFYAAAMAYGSQIALGGVTLHGGTNITRNKSKKFQLLSINRDNGNAITLTDLRIPLNAPSMRGTTEQDYVQISPILYRPTDLSLPVPVNLTFLRYKHHTGKSEIAAFLGGEWRKWNKRDLPMLATKQEIEERLNGIGLDRKSVSYAWTAYNEFMGELDAKD